MEPAVRLTVTDALAAMAAEVTAALDGDLVDIRLRGRDPEVVVVPAEHAPADRGRARRRPSPTTVGRPHQPRLPDAPEGACRGRGRGRRACSLNTWLVRAVAAALRDQPPPPSSGRGPRRYTGFARS